MPVDPRLIPAFLLAVAAVELTPGPNMGYLAALSASRGWRSGLAAVLGVSIGLAAYMLAAVLGIAEAVAAFPGLLSVLHWAGVAYLAWLALEAWRGSAETSPGHASWEGSGRQVWRGFVANLLNAKAAVFYVLLLPGFIVADRAAPAMQALTWGCIHLAVSVLVHSGIVFAAAGAGKALFSRFGGAHGLPWRRAFAVSLLLVAAWLAFATPA